MSGLPGVQHGQPDGQPDSRKKGRRSPGCRGGSRAPDGCQRQSRPSRLWQEPSLDAEAFSCPGGLPVALWEQARHCLVACRLVALAEAACGHACPCQRTCWKRLEPCPCLWAGTLPAALRMTSRAKTPPSAGGRLSGMPLSITLPGDSLRSLSFLYLIPCPALASLVWCWSSGRGRTGATGSG